MRYLAAKKSSQKMIELQRRDKTFWKALQDTEEDQGFGFRNKE